MRSLQREPGLLLALLAVIVLVGVFIVYPQIRVIATPGTGYVDFLTGGSWVKATLNSLQVMALSTTSDVILFGPRGLITYGIFGQTISVFGLSGIWGVQTIAFFPIAYQLIADVLSR